MLETIRASLSDLLQRGGIVMWPLLGISILVVTLAFERCWFWMATNRPSRLARLRRIGVLIRRGDRAAVRVLNEGDRSVYGRVVALLIEDSKRPTDAVLIEAVESQRPRMERFMVVLSTIITAAPLLGILGTVIGIISSFQVLSDQVAQTDPRAVSQGIAEALLTTAAGLSIALIALFPHNAFRAQIDRTLGRIEILAAGRRTDADADGHDESE
jgi:biopolymer transport protein ExbB